MLMKWRKIFPLGSVKLALLPAVEKAFSDVNKAWKNCLNAEDNFKNLFKEFS